MTNFLTLIPAKYRLYIYAAYALAGVLFGAMDVGFEAASVPDPLWHTVSVKVYTYLGIALALTAASNVTPNSDPPPAPESNPLR